MCVHPPRRFFVVEVSEVEDMDVEDDEEIVQGGGDGFPDQDFFDSLIRTHLMNGDNNNALGTNMYSNLLPPTPTFKFRFVSVNGVFAIKEKLDLVKIMAEADLIANSSTFEVLYEPVLSSMIVKSKTLGLPYAMLDSRGKMTVTNVKNRYRCFKAAKKIVIFLQKLAGFPIIIRKHTSKIQKFSSMTNIGFNVDLDQLKLQNDFPAVPIFDEFDERCLIIAERNLDFQLVVYEDGRIRLTGCKNKQDCQAAMDKVFWIIISCLKEEEDDHEEDYLVDFNDDDSPEDREDEKGNMNSNVEVEEISNDEGNIIELPAN